MWHRRVRAHRGGAWDVDVDRSDASERSTLTLAVRERFERRSRALSWRHRTRRSRAPRRSPSSASGHGSFGPFPSLDLACITLRAGPLAGSFSGGAPSGASAPATSRAPPVVTPSASRPPSTPVGRPIDQFATAKLAALAARADRASLAPPHRRVMVCTMPERAILPHWPRPDETPVNTDDTAPLRPVSFRLSPTDNHRFERCPQQNRRITSTSLVPPL